MYASGDVEGIIEYSELVLTRTVNAFAMAAFPDNVQMICSILDLGQLVAQTGRQTRSHTFSMHHTGGSLVQHSISNRHASCATSG